MPVSDAAVDQLQAARVAEKEQALFYRALSSVAEEQGHTEDVEALNGLLADEQHHLSRISVRLVELGIETPDIDAAAPGCAFERWREVARVREREEIRRYECLLAEPLDQETAAMIREFLTVERQHEHHLAGKYTEA